MSRRLRTTPAVIVAIVLLAGAVVLYFSGAGRGGEATPERTVAAYVKALNQNDRQRLDKLMDPTPSDRDQQIDRQLQLYGGKLDVQASKITDSESSGFKTVQLSGTLDGRPFNGQIGLTRTQNRWFITPFR